MKKLLAGLAVAVAGIGLVAADADARRLGGGGSIGMQRSIPARQAPTSPPPHQQPQQAPAANPAPAGATAAAAAAPRRSWLGPVAGLAAGLGIAALMSHLGLGAEFANFLMLALLAVVAIALIRFVMRRFAADRGAAPQGMRFAGAGPGSAVPPTTALPAGGWSGGAPRAAASASVGGSLPAGFDAPAFERIAKMIFIRMQAANDAGDLEDLRQFATPEMYAAFRIDLHERNGAPQKTDVVQLDAEVLDVAEEAGRQIVSVRFHGLIREEPEAPAAPFDEVWHLVRPTDGSREWAIAGIGQQQR